MHACAEGKIHICKCCHKGIHAISTYSKQLLGTWLPWWSVAEILCRHHEANHLKFQLYIVCQGYTFKVHTEITGWAKSPGHGGTSVSRV